MLVIDLVQFTQFSHVILSVSGICVEIRNDRSHRSERLLTDVFMAGGHGGFFNSDRWRFEGTGN